MFNTTKKVAQKEATYVPYLTPDEETKKKRKNQPFVSEVSRDVTLRHTPGVVLIPGSSLFHEEKNKVKLTMDEKGNFNFRITQSSKLSMDLMAYSSKGISKGKNSDTYYLNLECDYEHAGFDKKTHNLLTYISTVNDYSKKIFDAYIDTLADICGVGDIKSSFLAVINPKLYDSKLIMSQIVGSTIFINPKFVRLFQMNLRGKRPERIAQKLHDLLGSTGNSEFLVNLKLSTTDINVDILHHVVTITTFINANSIYWLNRGQNTDVEESASAKAKQKEETDEEERIFSLFVEPEIKASEILSEAWRQNHSMASAKGVVSSSSQSTISSYFPPAVSDEDLLRSSALESLGQTYKKSKKNSD